MDVGIPGGIIGWIASTFMGWIPGKGMVETRGLFRTWWIHFLSDVAIGLFLRGTEMLRYRVEFRILGVWSGAVAQLGERLVRNEEVVGSTPISSTGDGEYQACKP